LVSELRRFDNSPTFVLSRKVVKHRDFHSAAEGPFSKPSDRHTHILLEVASRLRTNIPKAVPMIGTEDRQELLQDGLAVGIAIGQGALGSNDSRTAGRRYSGSGAIPASMDQRD
jgi:hypothetical protein